MHGKIDGPTIVAAGLALALYALGLPIWLAFLAAVVLVVVVTIVRDDGEASVPDRERRGP